MSTASSHDGSNPSGSMGQSLNNDSPKKKKKEDSVLAVPMAFPVPNPQEDGTESANTSNTQNNAANNNNDPNSNSPKIVSDPTTLLGALRDEHSNYTIVAKTCLQIAQFAGHGSSGGASRSDMTSPVADSGTLLHEATYARIASNCIQAATDCLHGHKDRRCRSLAAHTLGILGKAAYARIRQSPLLYVSREAPNVRLEDEIRAELPTALVTAVLEDDDEGVSAMAIEALGILILFHSNMPGTQHVEDVATREILSLTAPTMAPYAPSLRSLCDEDPGTASTELAARILENVVQPRLWMIVERLLHYQSTSLLAKALPVLTAACAYQLQTTDAIRVSMDKATFAKQWVEVDAMGIVNTVVTSFIMPILQQSMDGHLAQTAALSALRLADACGNTRATWITPLCRSVILVQQEALSATPLSVTHKMHILATTMIAARAIPFPERTDVLQALMEPILSLPSTTRVPMGVSSAGLILDDYLNRSLPSSSALRRNQMQYGRHYRRPVRISFWTELALSFFLDGPAPTPEDVATAAAAASKSKDTSAPVVSGRQESLRKFLSMPVVSKVIGTDQSSSKAPLVPRDELLLAFTGVAIACGRRFRGGDASSNSGNNQGNAAMSTIWPVTDPSAQSVEEWLQLSWVVLTAFVPCVNMGRKLAYLEEDLSLGTAGLTQYVQLLQEYLHFAGLLHPGSSVAVKLVANACPPHLLWDQLSESAAYMARFESLDMGLLENTTKLLDEIVMREVKQGIPSHHMRLFLLALAADHWMQGRVAAIRKQFETPNANNQVPSLDVPSAREIIMALSPKRVLAKIFQSHVPPVDSEGKKKKDPIKRLAAETVKVCVACIENLALIACDWRKRFKGSTPENTADQPKHIVSVAVGVLQGKVDDTPANDTIKAVMAPVCEAAVGRIQAFYESDMGGADSFPASELVMQNIKTKIKPLVSSSSRPPHITKDEFARGYLMQLSRLMCSSRVDQAVYSIPPADADLAPARTSNWLRLRVPPISELRDGRVLGNRSNAVLAYDSSVKVASFGSDPVAIILGYTPRKYLRHDGQDEYRITALMRVYNATNVDLTEGLQLEIGMVNQSDVNVGVIYDVFEENVRQALGMSESDSISPPLASAMSMTKQELKPGEFLSWEVALDHMTGGEGLVLIPSVVFQNVPIEPVDVGTKLSADKTSGIGENSTINTGTESGGATGEDDFQVTETENKSKILKDGYVPSQSITFRGESLKVNPLVQFQPCPLVFYRDRWGDVDAFRFLWFRMPFHVPELLVTDEGVPLNHPKANELMRKVSDMSCLVWNGEAIPGGYVTRAWALSTLSGSRVLAVMAESDSDKKVSIHFRGDDVHVLYGLVGPPSSREQVVAALAPEFLPVLE